MDALAVSGIIAGALAVAQFVWGVYKDRKGGTLRKSQAEASKASLDEAQAAASLPHVTKALELGNIAEAVAIQQGVINGLREHGLWQDQQLREAADREADLTRQLKARDDKIRDLESRLDRAEEHLDEARRIIGELRATADGPVEA
jgi:chaperonin cofactor prefoldin